MATSTARLVSGQISTGLNAEGAPTRNKTADQFVAVSAMSGSQSQ